MDNITYGIKNQTSHRELPQNWSGKKFGFSGKAVDGAIEIARYSEKLFYSLLCIRHYYKEFFNKNNTTPIDDYIHLFNDTYEQIYDVIVNKSSTTLSVTKLLHSGFSWLTKGRFVVMNNAESYNKQCFKFSGSKTVGFANEAYQKLMPLAKKLFWIEKLCSFTTRKIWAEEITKPENFDPTKDYKVLARVVMPKTWRRHEHDENYEKDRIYFSTSLIDKKNRNKLFLKTFVGELAILLVEYEDNKFVCGDSQDDFSEEIIDDFTPNISKTEYTDVFKIDEVDVNGKNHKIFANAVETVTPMSIFRELGQYQYSEVNMKSPRIFGVIAPNKDSVDYAQKKAKELGVPYFSPEEFNS